LFLEAIKKVAASANIEHLDEKAKEIPIATKRHDRMYLHTVLSNSFGWRHQCMFGISDRRKS
jgi:3-oxoacyl-(acyl-carrier-protein) synthase